MKIINFNIDADNIEIVPLADWHIGSPQCDEELIRETCRYIAETPNCYCIINGDLLDNVTRNSIGDVFSETMSPQSQVATACYYLQDIAKKGKIINMLSGNHELRTNKETGLSLMDLLLAHLLKYDETLNERYCTEGAYTFITMGWPKRNTKITFTIYNLHGSGSGSRIGSKIARLDAMSEIVPATVYIRSHTHVPETHKGVYFDVNLNNHTVREQTCAYVNTGSMLKFGGYGERNGMKPLSRGIPVITLKIMRRESHGKDIYIKNVECVIKDHLGE